MKSTRSATGGSSSDVAAEGRVQEQPLSEGEVPTRSATGGSSSDGAAEGRVQEQPLSTGEVRRRAVSGAAVDLLRGFGARFLALIGTVVLARLLTPYDFGLVAVGAVFVTFATIVADGGIGAALIRRDEAPVRADLKALLAFQIGLNTVLALGVSVALFPFGKLGQVTALMMITLPLMAFRVPGVIVSERQLNYRPLAGVEIVESACYSAWAIVMVSEGAGVWGLASASVVRALVGSTLLLFLVPPARLIPSPSWRRIRPLVGFGLRYQAVGVANLARDQGIYAIVAAVAGVSAVGVWSIAHRILQVPLLLFGSLWRVSFPGMSRLVAAGEDVAGTLERVMAVAAVAAGLILAPLVAATPAWVPGFLGQQWADVVAVIPPASLHLMVMGPISVALVGYLWALGEASAVLRATLVGIPLLAAVMIPLLLVIGVPAIGFGWLASGVGEATVLILCARKHVELKIVPRLVPPVVFAALGASMGWFVTSEMGTTVVGGLAGGLFAAVGYVLALWLWHRSYLLDSVRLSIRGLRGAVGEDVEFSLAGEGGR
jgi:O-antigen/teichoic acid export membrane protein